MEDRVEGRRGARTLPLAAARRATVLLQDGMATIAVNGNGNAEAAALDSALAACRHVLAKLRMLSEAVPTTRAPEASGATSTITRLRTRPTDPLPPRTQHIASTMLPPDTELDRKSHEPPSKRFSLYAHYLWRIERARDEHDIDELRMLARMGLRDFGIATGRYRVPYHERHEQSVSSMLAKWRGWRAAEVAVYLNAPTEWVREQRSRNGRDPEHGELVEHGERLERVASMHAAGASVRAIADELGFSKTRVHEILHGA